MESGITDSDTADIDHFLERVGAFSALSATQRHRLAMRLEPVTAEAGQWIVQQGERGESCFLILSGKVEIIDQGCDPPRSLAVLEQGSLFGETSLLTGSPRNASVRSLETSKLLRLSRKDLIQVMMEDHATRRRILNILSLRDRPRQSDGIRTEEGRTEDGASFTLLKKNEGDPGFRLSPEGAYLWQQLDGQHNLKDLTLSHLEQFGSFAPHILAETLSGLVASGYAVSPVSGLLRRERPHWLSILSPILRPLQRLLTWKWVFSNLDRTLEEIYRKYSWWIFTRPAQLAILLLTGSGIVSFIAGSLHLSVYFQSLPLSQPWWLMIVLVIVLQNLVLHEAAHAFTVIALGRKVYRIGMGWHWISPVFFVDTTDMWQANRRRRMLVRLAGPYANIILGSVFSIVFVATSRHTPSMLVWIAAVTSYSIGLINLLPVMDLDGEHVLQEWRQGQEHRCPPTI